MLQNITKNRNENTKSERTTLSVQRVLRNGSVGQRGLLNRLDDLEEDATQGRTQNAARINEDVIVLRCLTTIRWYLLIEQL